MSFIEPNTTASFNGGIVTGGMGWGGLVLRGMGYGSSTMVPVTSPPNPWLSQGLNAIASVEIDSNATGAVNSFYGDAEPRYVPVSGLDAFRVCLIRSSRNDAFTEVRPQNELNWIALYNDAVALDMRHRLVIEDDPDRPGRKRYLEVKAPSEKVFRRAHRCVKLLERFGQPAS